MVNRVVYKVDDEVVNKVVDTIIITISTLHILIGYEDSG